MRKAHAPIQIGRGKRGSDLLLEWRLEAHAQGVDAATKLGVVAVGLLAQHVRDPFLSVHLTVLVQVAFLHHTR